MKRKNFKGMNLKGFNESLKLKKFKGKSSSRFIFLPFSPKQIKVIFISFIIPSPFPSLSLLSLENYYSNIIYFNNKKDSSAISFKD